MELCCWFHNEISGIELRQSTSSEFLDSLFHERNSFNLPERWCQGAFSKDVVQQLFLTMQRLERVPEASWIFFLCRATKQQRNGLKYLLTGMLTSVVIAYNKLWINSPFQQRVADAVRVKADEDWHRLVKAADVDSMRLLFNI